MRKILFTVSCIVLLGLVSFAAEPTTCENCHSKMKGRLLTPVEQWKTSVHYDVSINCVNCHGGDGTAQKMKDAHSKAKGWIGKPDAKQIVNLCGTCHANTEFIKKYNPNLSTDQLAQYKTSNHGIAVLKNGDHEAATCTSCHGAHDILIARSPKSHVYAAKIVDTCGKCHANKELMKKHNIEGNEVEAYKKSVHYKAMMVNNDLSAPTCNDCHGNHGATPPGVGSVVNVCGTCHVMNQRLFSKSPHKDWEESGLMGCMECHSNHEIHKPGETMLAKDTGVCLNCHSEDENAFKTMIGMHKEITDLDGGIKNVEQVIEQAENKGMLMDDEKIKLQEVHTILIKSRTAVHSFNIEKVKEVTSSGMTEIGKIKELAKKALVEVHGRRNYFYGFTALFILLIFFIGFKIRSMEK